MPSTPSDPADALHALAEQLRSEDTVVSERVANPSEPAALGALAAAGPATADDPAGYALVVESVREGYLLHYGEPRVILGAEPDLRLLAGDYLYALGLERLASLGAMAAVRELSDLISIGAQLHADATESAPDPAGEALWLASTVAIATGDEQGTEDAKHALRTGNPDARKAAEAAAEQMAGEAGLNSSLEAASYAIQSPASDPPDLGR